MEENVLVFPEKLIEGYNINGFVYYEDLPPTFIDRLLDGSSFLKRSVAEVSPEWKQIIPYCLISKDDKYLSYFRTKKAGEERLRGKRSIGFGGHINDTDTRETKQSTFYKGVERELKEELGLNPDDYSLYIEGVLYDNSDKVGEVHFGIVFTVDVYSENFDLSDDTISDRKFLFSTEIEEKIDEYENWSKLVIKG